MHAIDKIKESLNLLRVYLAIFLAGTITASAWLVQNISNLTLITKYFTLAFISFTSLFALLAEKNKKTN